MPPTNDASADTNVALSLRVVRARSGRDLDVSPADVRGKAEAQWQLKTRDTDDLGLFRWEGNSRERRLSVLRRQRRKPCLACSQERGRKEQFPASRSRATNAEKREKPRGRRDPRRRSSLALPREARRVKEALA
ncbi:UNVERIFIED_CONTAM: hypothetical protein HHA_450440 [Hammondia hammondi]|eukprot:XP_008889423.1 hypothetical protein HHA_450440 [Hammondia hammondi]